MPVPVASAAQQQSFVQNVYPYAQWASGQTGLPVDFIIGQAATESGWGLSSLAVNNNNLFGIGGPGNFASYGNIGQSFSAWVNTINGNYDTSAFGGMTPTQMGDSLAAQGYTPDAGYGATVGTVTAQIDNIMASMGLNGGSAGGSGSGSGNPLSAIASALNGGMSGVLGSATGAQPSNNAPQPNCGKFDYVCQVKAWISQVAGGFVWVVVGIVLLIAALFIFAKQSGIADNIKLPPIPVEV